MFSKVQPPENILWHRTAPPPPVCPALAGDIDVDVLVVGAGLTGLRTAVSLAEAGTRTAVIDAHTIGYGASGRSGGQCNPLWRASPDELEQRFGAAQAGRLIETTLTAADDLFDDIRRYGIDCDAEQNGWIQAAHTGRSARSLNTLGTAWRTVGADIETVEGSDLHTLTGSTEYDFALHHKKGGCVHPLALTRGFARTAQSFGAHLFENCPATKMKRNGGKWHVETPDGHIVSDTVVLTTNAYTDRLWPGLRRTLLSMVSIVLATEPLNEQQQASVLPGRLTISDSRLAIYFSRYDADNRLIFGCVGSGDTVDSWGGLGRLRKGLRTVFPQVAEAKIECTWSGRIGVTRDMMPHLHEPVPGVLAGLGFSGRGIAMTSVMGRTLARRILGGSNSELAFPVLPISPIPFHGISSTLIPLMVLALSARDDASILLDRGFR